MENEETKPNNVKDTVEVVTELVKAVPVYQDAVQPAAQEIGKSLATVAKTVNIALSPIKALVWGYEKIEVFLNNRISEKLKDVPDENIVTPAPNIAGPAIEALRFSGDDENLRELYASLLAAAMNIETIQKAHPGYVEIIKNLSSDEALLLKAFISNSSYPIIHIKKKSSNEKGFKLVLANYSNLNNVFPSISINQIPKYLSNLCRLGILEIPNNIHLVDENHYLPLESSEEINEIKIEIQNNGEQVEFDRRLVRVTPYGRDFIDNVVK